jgi:hypothetical protein
MYDIICQGCGKVFKADRLSRVFCSHSCSAMNRSRKCGSAHCDSSQEWKRVETNETMWVCPYNKSVECSFRKCDKCGWNPEVAERRIKDYLARNGGYAR